MNKVYDYVTNEIMERLRNNDIPWRKPWLTESINYVTRKPYKGINVLLLKRPGEYFTFNQIQNLGGKIKKGAKSEMVVFYKTLTISEVVEMEKVETGEVEKVEAKKEIPLLRYYRVFHIDDVEGIPSKIQFKTVVSRVEEAEKNNTNV